MTLGLFGFLSAIIGAWTAMNWYAFRNLAAMGLDRGALIPIIWALALTFPFMRLSTLKWSHPILRALYWVGAIWMGSAFLLSFWFLISSGLRHLLWAAGLGAAGHALLWIRITAAGVVAMIALGLLRALKGPRDVHYQIDHSARYGKGRRVRIAQISDVHLGLALGTDFLRGLVERINRLEPDLVFITGDLFDPEFPDDKAAAAILATLAPKQGTFAVSGNHEFYAGLGRFLAMMEAAGIPVLDNEMRRTGTGLQICGIHDQTAHRFASLGVACDLGKALRDIDHDMPSFLLAHQPKELEPAAAKRVDLIFSGHTHAGQIFPFRMVVRMAYRYVSGRYDLGSGTDLIVNTGTGFWGPPLRVGTHSQIVVAEFAY